MIEKNVSMIVGAHIWHIRRIQNEQLHRNRNVDDSLSGTTAVAVYLEGRDMWVANVGDSRAIVVQEHEGKLVARPLSSDQTPYRKVR